MRSGRRLLWIAAFGAILAAGNHTASMQASAMTQHHTPTINMEQVTLLGQQAACIEYGMHGDAVREVQQLLSQAGHLDGAVDGVFGWQTFHAVEAFQSAQQIPVTGVVDEATLAALRRAEPSVSRDMRMLPMLASGYSAYDPGNSYYTATGSLLRRGVVAVDPNIIPLGTKLFIPGYGYAVADDTGGSIVGMQVDLAFDSHEEALAFGRRNIVVYIVE